MSLKRPHPDASSPTAAETIFVSGAIEDRDSTFIARFSPSATSKELQKHPEFQSAMHRIAAWRRPSAQKTLKAERIYDTGHDDDGERWAGKRLEKVLVDMKVEGAVVVARWYGGTMLGPIRFNHIENCAREAIGKYLGVANSNVAETHVEEPGLKRIKTVEERNEERARRDELAETLKERDASIDVLRQLLTDKQSDADVQSSFSPNKAKPSYGGMSLDQMTRLEKARDATIAWLLKQIDMAEKEQEKLKSVKQKQRDEEEDAWAAFEEAIQEPSAKGNDHDHG